MKNFVKRTKRLLIIALVFVFSISLVSPALAGYGLIINNSTNTLNNGENDIWGVVNSASNAGASLIKLQTFTSPNIWNTAFAVDPSGNITALGKITPGNASGVCLSDGCKTSWASAGGLPAAVGTGNFLQTSGGAWVSQLIPAINSTYFTSLSGANLTNLSAAQITGTIPSATLGNSSVFIGTTAVPLNRTSGPLTLAGVTSALATALAANGTNCVAGNYPLGVDASGNAESCTVIPALPAAVGTGNILQTNGGAWVSQLIPAINSTYFTSLSGANLTALPASQITGTIPAAVLGNSPLYIGTTLVTLNRGSGALTLAGVTSALATALASTPTKCSAGNYPLGVDASGNAQNCTAAGGGIGGSGTANTVAKFTAGTTLGNSIITDYGTGVGIGSTFNNAKLNFISDATSLLIGSTRSDGTVLGSLKSNGWGSFSVAGGLAVGYDWPNSSQSGMIINGNVGIGSASPIAKLDVNGDIFAGGNGQVYLSGNQINARYNTNASDELALNYVGYLKGTTQFRDTNVYNGKNSSIAFFQGSSGKVGIGTTAPGATLEINNTSGTAGTIETILSKAISDNGFKLVTEKGVTTNNTGDIMDKIGLAYMDNTNNNSFIRFHRGGSAIGGFMSFSVNNDSEVMRIAANGSVGIGTNAPNNKLQVNGATRIVAQGSSWEDQLNLYSNDGTNRWNILVDNGSADALRFAYNGGAVDAMYINTSGNVGIGTTNPVAKLDVENSGGTYGVYSVAGVFGVYGSGMVGVAGVGTTGVQAQGTSYDFAGTSGNPSYFMGQVEIGGGSSPNAALEVDGRVNAFSSASCGTQGSVAYGAGCSTSNTGYGFSSDNGIDSGLFSDADGHVNIINNGRPSIMTYESGSVAYTYLPYGHLTLNDNSAYKPSGGSWSATSDQRVKKDIVNLDSKTALDKLTSLQAKEYQWINPDAHTNDTGVHAAIMAQDLQKVFPDWVTKTDPVGADKNIIPAGDQVLNVGYPNDFNAYLIAALKELKQENQDLQTQNSDKQTQLNNQQKEINAMKAAIANLQK
jgi:hypothetical protein